MKRNNVILVAHHRKSFIIDDGIYMPIHVGKEISTIDLGITGDNTGNNISNKNPIYCEMTALYWAWKNLKADYIGLCHYRRYFTFDKNRTFSKLKDWCKYYIIKYFGNCVKPGVNYMMSNQILVDDQEKLKEEALNFSFRIDGILDEGGCDLIIPHPYYISNMNLRQYFQLLGNYHINLLEEIVCDLYPKFAYYVSKSLKSNHFYAANMFVMKKEFFNDYCSIVFQILQEHERRIIKNGWCSDPLNEKCYSRISGYLAELITNAYIEKLIDDKIKFVKVNTIFCNSI